MMVFDKTKKRGDFHPYFDIFCIKTYIKINISQTDVFDFLYNIRYLTND
jgi:hypothetical protein